MQVPTKPYPFGLEFQNSASLAGIELKVHCDTGLVDSQDRERVKVAICGTPGLQEGRLSAFLERLPGD